MNVYIVRHGDARAIGGAISSDSERPLSQKGEGDIRLMGQVLARMESAAPLMVSSPLLRARATASLLAEPYGAAAGPEQWEELAPGVRFKAVISRLQSAGASSVVLVGHQPDMTHLIAFLIADAATEIVMPPGAMALLVLPHGSGAGAARLQWLLTPDLVRLLTPTNG
jgi:phosphohistidine phosphatase SixA